MNVEFCNRLCRLPEQELSALPMLNYYGTRITRDYPLILPRIEFMSNSLQKEHHVNFELFAVPPAIVNRTIMYY